MLAAVLAAAGAAVLLAGDDSRREDPGGVLGARYSTHEAARAGRKLLPPAQGVYHAAFPFTDGAEDVVSREEVLAFNRLAGRRVVWAQFSDNWFDGIEYPAAKAAAIWSVDRTIPYVRLLPRSDWTEGCKRDNPYALARFLEGRFDAALRRYARDVEAAGIPIVVDFGVEMNGDWFPWSGACNGGGMTTGYGDPAAADGPERFRDTYRRIIDIFRAEGADDVTWMFHVDAYNAPERTSWNTMRAYYPGDAYIDWIGVSAYAAQSPGELRSWNPSLRAVLDDAYPELAKVSTTKPIALAEWGQIEHAGKPGWIRDGLRAVAAGSWPRIKAISYWHQSWDGSNMRIDSSPAALAAYRGLPARYVSKPRLSR